jgi:hypothetical protein
MQYNGCKIGRGGDSSVGIECKNKKSATGGNRPNRGNGKSKKQIEKANPKEK